MALTGIARMNADDSYTRCGNFGCSPVQSMVLIYPPDGTNIYGSRGAEIKQLPFMLLNQQQQALKA